MCSSYFPKKCFIFLCCQSNQCTFVKTLFMIKTVIFDMDGVLVDTEPVHFIAYIKHFKELNIDVSEEMYQTFIGSSTKNIYKRIKEHFNLPQSLQELIVRKRELFYKAFNETTTLKLMDGVLDLIQEVYQNNIQLIVASSSSYENINAVFKRFDLDKYFSHKVSGEDFPESKPNPAIFNKAVELSGHQKNECIVIEDSTNGIKAANSAGVFVIGYQAEESNQNYETADWVISNYNEINFEVIQKIERRE